MTNTAVRLLTLISLLQRRSNQKAADLAQELGVSVRSVHRYMDMLDEMGLPIYTERGPWGGFSMVRGYRMPPLIFTPDEAVVLSLGAGLVEDLFGALYQTAVRSVLAKLDNIMPEDQRGEAAWARRALIAGGMLRADLERLGPHLETLRNSLRDLRRVSMRYQGAGGGEPLSRELDPYVLAFQQGWWYVAGYCHLRQDVRIFRVDRILELTTINAHFEIPPDFDARRYLQDAFHSPAQITMRMRFYSEHAHLAHQGHSFWETMQDEMDGSVLVSLKVPDAVWGASTALAYGPAVIVLEPDEVIELVREWSLAVARQYEPDPLKR